MDNLKHMRISKLFIVILLIFQVLGCATHADKDPLESFNRAVYKFNDVADGAIIKPVSKGYKNIAPKLDQREISFRKIFKYLDSQPTPIIIVETGCLRVKDNFLDGQSTLLFDKYTLSRGEQSKVYTVDINPNSTKVTRGCAPTNMRCGANGSS